MKRMILPALYCIIGLMTSATVAGEFSTTGTITSDYLFNGVSQTDHNPAVQASLDYSADNGVYIGTWASNVDFGDTNTEVDVYIGQYKSLNETFAIDYGLAYYGYFGASNSDEMMYPEAHFDFITNTTMGSTTISADYSWDYFGLGGEHIIYGIAHQFDLSEGHTIKASWNLSESLDTDTWMWEDSSSYNHYQIEYMTSLSGFDLTAGYSATDLEDKIADDRFFLSISKTFSL